MTPINGPATTLADDLGAPSEFRIINASSPSLQGDAVDASFGVDNITAAPEPTTLAALGAMLLVLVRRRPRRQGD